MSSRGANRERAVRLVLEADGYWVGRCAGSLGDADLVALKAEERPKLIEVKSTAGGPYERFGPRQRLELLDAARIAGADALLAWWPPRGVLWWIPSDEWPLTAIVPVVA